MASIHSLANAITSATHRTERFIQPKISMVELPDFPQCESDSRRYENSPLLYSDATYNVRDFISQEDNESLNKSYGDGSPNEICASKLDQGKIDELANDYRAETCVSSSRESSIQKESRKETIKSDDTLSRNEHESRCKSNRKRKTRRKIPEGIIIDLSNDVYATSRGGIKISVISMHNLLSKMKFVAVPKKRARYLLWNSSPRKKLRKKMLENPTLTVLCAENRSKQKCRNRSKKSISILYRNVNTTVAASKERENVLNGGRELHVENNTRSLCIPNEIFSSTECCHRDDTLVNIDNARYPILNTERTCIDARKCIANYCCSIFNDKHREYHICDREDYNADGSDFNAEMQTDWRAECFHPEYTRAKGCRCFYDSNGCDPDVNMPRDHCPMSRTARLFENSTFPRKRQREEEVVPRTADIASEFATEANVYSPDGAEWCAVCNRKKRSFSVSTIWKRVASRTGESADPPRCEIDPRSGRRGWRITTTTAVETDGDRLYKSDLLKGPGTRNVGAWRDNCIGRRCADRVVAEPLSHTYRLAGKKGESARGVDSEWKRDSIETDAQQLDYKWKRRIATLDAGTCARTDFTGTRDSRYKSKEAIRVQLRESAEIRKRESLEMAEATSQMKNDNINADGKRREKHDYSLWTSLQMSKIWSRMHDVYKNVIKLTAASVNRVVKDAPQSERSRKNPVKVADAMLVKSSSSCADKICGEPCRKNLMRSKSGEEMEARRERTVGDVGKYHEDTEAPMRKNSRTVAPSLHRDRQNHAYQNAEKVEDKESCLTYDECERDRFRDTVEFPLQNETCGHDEDVQSQSRLSESFTNLKNYLRFRIRGGSDDNRDSARGSTDKQKSMQRIYEDAGSIKCYRNSISKECICYDEAQEARVICTDRSLRHVACYELHITAEQQATRADVSATYRNNPLYRESQSANTSSPEDTGRMETPAMLEQTRTTRSREETETCESIENTTNAETERSLTSEIADAMVSSTRVNPTVHSSRNDPDEPTASTSKRETSPVSPGKSQRDRPRLKTPFCMSAMKFWRRRSLVDTIALVLKRDRRTVGREELSSTAATTYDSGVKITQIELPTVQTAREGNERAYVNLQVQTPDVIVARILSEFLLSGEKRKKMLMSITLESTSDHDKREGVGTQTSSNDLTSVGIATLDYPATCPQCAITTCASKAVQCFECDKPDCYEIRQSNNSLSISLEEALIAEYPERSDLNDCLAERKADNRIPP